MFKKNVEDCLLQCTSLVFLLHWSKRALASPLLKCVPVGWLKGTEENRDVANDAPRILVT